MLSLSQERKKIHTKATQLPATDMLTVGCRARPVSVCLSGHLLFPPGDQAGRLRINLPRAAAPLQPERP